MFSTNDLKVRGLGASLDLGYSIQKNKNAGISYCPNLYEYGNAIKSYRWKAGISLLDIGVIHYYKNTLVTKIKNSDILLNRPDSLKYKDFNAIDVAIKENFNTNNIEATNNFWLILPSVVCAQFDYNLTNSFFINSIIYQRINLVNIPALSRMNTLTIGPRYETEFFSVFMPFILNEYKDLNWGLAVRFKYFTIGSDRFGETFGLQNIYGANLYGAFKYNIINKRRFRKKLF